MYKFSIKKLSPIRFQKDMYSLYCCQIIIELKKLIYYNIYYIYIIYYLYYSIYSTVKYVALMLKC